ARVGPLRHRVRQPGRRRAAQHRDLHEFLGQHGALSRRYVRGLADRDLPCPASAAGNVLLSLRRPPRADDRDAHGQTTVVDYRTIVVGTDGSVTATSALRAAVRFATRCKAKLVLVCAFDPPRISRAMAETVLEHAARSARREGVEVEVETGAAEPAGLILGVAERRGAGLVVVGNKGIGEATRFRLGSVPDRVAHQAGCDVLVVDTSGAPGPTRADRGYRTLLIGTDGSATASEAARKGLELAMILRADAELIYVGDPIVGAITLEETAATAPERVTVRTHVAQGDPTNRIVGVATEIDADLVVVGNKGMSGARRFLLGSVPNQLAHAVP